MSGRSMPTAAEAFANGKEGGKSDEDDTPGVLNAISAIALRGLPDDANSRVVKKIHCPIKDCSQTLKKWFCGACQTQVAFTLDGWCLCKCGQYPLRGTEVRCNSKMHIFPIRVATSVPDEFYNVVVFASSHELSKKFVGNVSDNAGAVRYRQQIVNFVDMAKSGDQLKQIHAVCIVVPKRSRDDQPIMFRSQLMEAKFLLGSQILKNVIVCSEEELPGEISVGVDDWADRLLELTEDLNMPTLCFGAKKETEFLRKLVGRVSACKPVHVFHAACRDNSEKMAKFAENLGKICGILVRVIEENLECYAAHNVSKKKTVVYTHPTNQLSAIQQLAMLDPISKEDLTENTVPWRSDMLVIDSEEVESAELLKGEHEDLKDYARRLIIKVQMGTVVKKQRRELASVCAFLAEGRYCLEVAEYLEAMDVAQTPFLPVDAATVLLDYIDLDESASTVSTQTVVF